MSRRDGTGNSGNSLGQGRGLGLGRGGRAIGPMGSNLCTCPKCGHRVSHVGRGIPCTQTKCPKCKTLMTGEFC